MVKRGVLINFSDVSRILYAPSGTSIGGERCETSCECSALLYLTKETAFFIETKFPPIGLVARKKNYTKT